MTARETSAVLEMLVPSDALQYVLVDRDGVINQDRPGSVLSRAEFALIARVPDAIALLNRKGYRVLVVTNQACVGRGDLSREELDAIHALMREKIAAAGGHIDKIYVCPHTDEDDCECRKPRTGLIERARRDFGFIAADTWMIGDDLRDIEAATTAGCRPAIVYTGKLSEDQLPGGVTAYRDLMNFAENVADTEQDG